MVRFNDKAQISTVASNDILPITDISDSSDDKKITVTQLSQFTVDNISTLTDGLGFSKNNLTDTLKSNYDTAYKPSHGKVRGFPHTPGFSWSDIESRDRSQGNRRHTD